MSYRRCVVRGTPHAYQRGSRSFGSEQPPRRVDRGSSATRSGSWAPAKRGVVQVGHPEVTHGTLTAMYAGPLRLFRAFIVSATCVALSLAAHLLGAGSGAPVASVLSVAGLLITTLLLMLVLTAFSGRRWTVGRSLVALGLGQVGLHATFMVLLAAPEHHGPDAMGAMAGAAGGASMTLAHAAAFLLTGVVIAVNDCALDTYFRLASSLVGSGIAVLSPWRLTALVPILDAAARVGAAGRAERIARWKRPHILTDLVLVQCLSRRGPPAFVLSA
jgi:hypothetical protein